MESPSCNQRRERFRSWSVIGVREDYSSRTEMRRLLPMPGADFIWIARNDGDSQRAGIGR